MSPIQRAIFSSSFLSHISHLLASFFFLLLISSHSLSGTNNDELTANLIGKFPTSETGAADSSSSTPFFRQQQQKTFGSHQRHNNNNNNNNLHHHHQSHHHHHHSQQSDHGLSTASSSSSTSFSHAAWGYESFNGPHTWGKHCRHGTRQSPVDIRSSQLEFAYINQLHFVNYELSGAVELKNNGHGVVASGFDKWEVRQRPHVYGGGLSGKYLLLQFHFHWALEHLEGSEHTLNGLHYPVELHLVHVKEGFTFTEALEQPDGLAVVGIFMHIGQDGSSMANLETALKRVVEMDSATLIFNYTVGVHLPPVLENFYRYQGSLTTPGCEESVIWTLMAEPMPMLVQQLELLRAVQGTAYGKRLVENVRPVQPLNGRRVQFRSSALNRQKICGGGNETLATRPSSGAPFSSARGGAFALTAAAASFMAVASPNLFHLPFPAAMVNVF